ncbi:type IV pilus modification protein PilV [Tepidimonas fonticaldi]|uniref:Type IV pilus modification protein PilV n=1 Tax=Tepidimonas fonticaldi TaxID=1101373 RepID=A0A554XPR2_9BURK|nr:hypothetical protein [Tepidimonas fonticaldi]TSE37787.1 type IV pilus modification protein PilV [Tepidimonas fonticaldi]
MLKLNAARGITLVENLIALLVVTAGVVGAVRMQSAILDAHCSTKNHATTLASITAAVEQLRANSTTACCDPASGCSVGIASNLSVNLTSSTNTSCNYRISITTTSQCKSPATMGGRSLDFTIPIAQKTAVSGSGGETGIEIPKPIIAELRNKDTGISNPNLLPGTISASETASDRNAQVAIREDSGGRFVLYARNNSTGNFFERLISNTRYVRITGVLFNGNNVPTIASLRSTNGLTIFATGAAFCQFPLNYSDANNPETYVIGAPATAMSAAYICYVPEGWYGNVGIDFTSVPNKIWACPDGAAPGTANNPDIYGGFRSLKSIYSSPIPPNVETDIKGQSGLLARHEAEQRLRGLHFILYSNNQKGFCPTVIQNPDRRGVAQGLSFISPGTPTTTQTFFTVGYGGISQTKAISPPVAGALGIECRNPENNNGNPTCLRPLDYWVEIIGLSSVTGTLTRADNGFAWSAVTLLANRTSPYGGIFSSACSVETVPTDEQFSKTSVAFTCLVGSGETITLGVPEDNGVELTEASTPSITQIAPKSGVQLFVKSK